MLYILTGKPGNGKTLFLLDWAQKEWIPEGRKVYTHGIDGITLDGFHQLPDPEKWWEVEPNSVVVMDEAQQTFPQRTRGEPPEHARKFEVHRHYGLDVVLITQDPMQLDTWVRRLAGRHIHLVRPFNAQRANVFRWQNVVTEPTDHFQQKQALQETFKFPKQLYGKYHSADGHTHKADIPWKKISYIGASAVGVAAMIWFAFYWVGTFTDVAQEEYAEQSGRQVDAAIENSGLAGQAANNFRKTGRHWSVEDYAEQFTPRVDGLPFSASFYDEEIEPKGMPVVMGCIQIETPRRKVCECETQQGTRIPMPYSQCRQIMRDGFYDFSGERERVLEEMRVYRASLSHSGSGFSGRTASDRDKPEPD